MMMAQSNRHSKTLAKVVNEKKEGIDFNATYRMLGREGKEAPDEEVRSQKSGVRRQDSGVSSQNSGARSASMSF